MSPSKLLITLLLALFAILGPLEGSVSSYEDMKSFFSLYYLVREGSSKEPHDEAKPDVDAPLDPLLAGLEIVAGLPEPVEKAHLYRKSRHLTANLLSEDSNIAVIPMEEELIPDNCLACCSTLTHLMISGKLAYDLGDYDQAIDYLMQAQAIDNSNPLLHHFIGLTAFENGDDDLALQAFEAALNLNPTYALSQLGRVRVLERMGYFEEEEIALEDLLENNELPDWVWHEGQRRLDQLQYEKKHFASLLVEAGYSWDSNATLENGTIPLPIVPEFDPLPSGEADGIIVVSSFIDYQYQVSPSITWWNRVGFHFAEHNEEDPLDLRILFGSTGIQSRTPYHESTFFLSAQEVKKDDAPFENHLRLNLHYCATCLQGGTWEVGFLGALRHHFAENPGIENTRGVVAETRSRLTVLALCPQSFYMEGFHRYDRAPRDNGEDREYHRLGLKLGWGTSLCEQIHLDLYGLYRSDRYENLPTTLLPPKRRDHAVSAVGSICWEWDRRLSISAVVDYLHNTSNLPQHDFEALRTGVFVQMLFD